MNVMGDFLALPVQGLEPVIPPSAYWLMPRVFIAKESFE